MSLKTNAALIIGASVALILGNQSMSVAGPAKTVVLNPYTLVPTQVSLPVVVTPRVVLVPVTPAALSGLAPTKGSGTPATGLPTLPPPLGGGSPPPPAPPVIGP